MNSNQLILEYCLFESIHIVQQGAVINGDQRNVSINHCYFHDITTSQGGSCIDLSSSFLVIQSSCFFYCTNTCYGEHTFSNIAKLIGRLLKLYMISSHRCSDSSVSGDSSFYAESNEMNMSDTNASSNYSPYGVSSIRTAPLTNQKHPYIIRALDINSVSYASFEVLSNAIQYISYSCVKNSTKNYYVAQCTSVSFSWCIFIEQCNKFCYSVSYVISATNCYSDQQRNELPSTTSLFDILFFNMDILICKKKIDEYRRECSSSNKTSLIKKHCCSVFIHLMVNFFNQ